MTIRVCLRRLAGVAAVCAAALMGIQDVAAQQFEEIVVTARKRDESVLEIPVAVSAYSQEDLDALGMNTLEQLASVTPGFVFQTIGAGGFGGRYNPAIRFRGLGVQQATPASRAGAVFWNGAYVSDGAGILPLMDLERVEILKGPQTAFFGRNTFAGAVNYIPATPGDEFSGKVSLSYSASDESSHNFTGSVGGPISDKVGVRIALSQERVGADWAFDNGDPLNEENTTAVTGTATFEASDALSFQVTGFYVDSDDTRILQSQEAHVAAGSCNRTYTGNFRSVGTGQNDGSFTTDLSQSPRATFCGNMPDWDATPVNFSDVGNIDASTPLFSTFFWFGFPFPVSSNPWSFVTTLPPEMEGVSMVSPPGGLENVYELWRIDLSGEYQLANDGVITAQIARGESSSWVINDNNFGTPTVRPAVLPPFLPTNTSGAWLSSIASWVRDTYIETRYTPPAGERMNWTIGASYYTQDNQRAAFQAFGPTHNLNFQDGDNFGIFGSVDYALTEQWTLSLEGRWNTDTQTIVYDGVSVLQNPNDPGAIVDAEQKYSAFMPRLIISWQPSENTNLYAHFSKSNLQGIDTNAGDYTERTGIPLGLGFFTPKQTLSAFEVGLKQQLGGWLNYAVAVFAMDWDNQTFFELSPAPFFTAANLFGDAEIRGMEIEFDVSPNEWFNFSGGFAYNSVEFVDFAGAGSVASAVLAPTLSLGQQISSVGYRPRYMPEWTGSLSTTVQVGQMAGLASNVWLRLDGIYMGQFYIDNFEWNSVEGHWKLNARLHADIDECWSVEAYGTNLTNDLSHTTAGGTTSITGSLNRKNFAPLPRKREVGLRVTYNF
ncbi:MAG: TonB-dependent receptor [Gammaproteobacteria bacterium]|nr:TonB-dependent receptor [Gammaproteobacteria bacterium]